MQHWDIYWQNTRTLNSFAEGHQGLGYQGDVAKFWQSIFAELANEARVLDLASGNGALAVLALQSNNLLNVSASDRANISPLQLFDERDSQYKYLKNIKFHGNMSSEELSFPNEQFDIVVSQFGFEYSEPKRTLQQLQRILKYGGKFVALVHHSESFISRDCDVGLSVLQIFTEQNGLIEKTKDFAKCCQQLQCFESLSMSQQQLLKQQSDQLLASFVSKQRLLASEHLEWFNVVAKDIVPLLTNWRSISVDAVDNLFVSLSHFKQRIADQNDASWNAEKLNAIQHLAKSLSFSVSCSTLETKEGRFCWVFQLTK